MFRIGIETTETNRIFPKQTEKISKKFGGPRNRQFFSWFEPKQTETQSVPVVFRFAFLQNPKKILSVCFSLFRFFGPISKLPKQTELMVWGIKKVHILTNVLMFRLVFCLFRLF